MRAPEFWQTGGLLPLLLRPLSALYAWETRRRWRKAEPWTAPVPVLCIGNLVAGGAGKTPVALSLGTYCRERGAAVHYLTRGYGGSAKGPLAVESDVHSAAEVGDEALLLARRAPTWVSRDRVAGARAAIAAGARLIVMDDGFQNPSLAKTLSLIVIDGGYGLGNGQVLPAGPLREPSEDGFARAQGIVLMGEDEVGVTASLPAHLPLLKARLVPAESAKALAGRTVVALAGIARPVKFFRALSEIGCIVVARHAFADHYPYDEREIRRMLEEARSLDALLVTTPKDAVRLPPSLREQVTVVEATVAWEDPAALDRLLQPLLDAAAKPDG